jgi:rRNA maturation endonuclease Nob1
VTATDDKKVYLSFPILKVEENADGDLVVWGKATDGSIDSDDQIVDPEWSATALTDWLKSGGNVRVMHSPQLYPAGKGVEVETTEDGHYVKSLVVEPTAKTLVQKGVLQAYSVGIARPQIVRDAKARGGRVVGGYLAELSLVDRPANKNCGVQLLKSDSGRAVDTYRVFGDLTALENAPGRPAGALSGADVDEPEIRKAPEALLTKQALDGHDDRYTPEAMEAYSRERRAWLEAQPVDGTPERAAWVAKGETEGLAGGTAGFERWLDARTEPAAEARPVEAEAAKGELSSKERDALDNSDFAYVDSSGEGHLPVHDESHVRAALGRFSQTDFESGKAKRKAARTILSRAKQHGIDVADDSDVARAAKKKADAEVTKGAKDCTNCGKTYHADSKMRTCENCGHDLPRANKGEEPDAAKGKAKQCPDCNTYNDADAGECSNCGHDMSSPSDADSFHGKRATGRGLPADVKPAGKHREPDGEVVEAYERDAGEEDGDEGRNPDTAVPKAEKKAKQMCNGCGANIDRAHKFCPECGKSTKGATPLGKNHKFTCLGCGNHPLDKGEKFCPNCGKENPGFNPSQKADAPYAVKRMHDWMCAAYDEADVLDAYPALKAGRDALSDAWLHTRLQGAEGEEAVLLRGLVDAVDVLAKADADAVADARAELRKGFHDAYPDAHPTPGEVTPGRFRRPFLDGGHYRQHASGGQSKVPPSAKVPDPGDFDRGPLTAGHADPSPAASRDNNPTPGSARTYYTNAARDQARNALAALHDHIASTFPELCPMATTKDGVPDTRADARPQEVGATAHLTGRAPGEKADEAALAKAVKAARKAAKAAARAEKAAQTPPSLDYGALQALMDRHTEDMRAQHADEIARLRAKIEKMESEPDPAQAPVRGVVEREDPQQSRPLSRAEILKRDYTDPEQAEYLMGLIESTVYPHRREAAREQLDRLRKATPETTS